jgi:hypothetical protein
MRDWFLALAPLAAALYFLIYPDQFKAIVDWAASLLH